MVDQFFKQKVQSTRQFLDTTNFSFVIFHEAVKHVLYLFTTPCQTCQAQYLFKILSIEIFAISQLFTIFIFQACRISFRRVNSVFYQSIHCFFFFYFTKLFQKLFLNSLQERRSNLNRLKEHNCISANSLSLSLSLSLSVSNE